MKTTTFVITEEALGELDQMSEEMNAVSRAEVIRRALALLKSVLAAERRGAELFIHEPDGAHVRIMPLQ